MNALKPIQANCASTGPSSATVAKIGSAISATSSASSKLVHGGLRYLEHFEFRLVRESLAEREVLLAIAPHIVRLSNLAATIPPEELGDAHRTLGTLVSMGDYLSGGGPLGQLLVSGSVPALDGIIPAYSGDVMAPFLPAGPMESMWGIGKMW